MEKTREVIRLARQEFRIVCDDAPDYLHELEASVNGKIAEVQEKYPTMSTLRCALLAMLNMEDDIRKSEKAMDGNDKTGAKTKTDRA